MIYYYIYAEIIDYQYLNRAVKINKSVYVQQHLPKTMFPRFVLPKTEDYRFKDRRL